MSAPARTWPAASTGISAGAPLARPPPRPDPDPDPGRFPVRPVPAPPAQLRRLELRRFQLRAARSPRAIVAAVAPAAVAAVGAVGAVAGAQAGPPSVDPAAGKARAHLQRARAAARRDRGQARPQRLHGDPDHPRRAQPRQGLTSRELPAQATMATASTSRRKGSAPGQRRRLSRLIGVDSPARVLFEQLRHSHRVRGWAIRGCWAGDPGWSGGVRPRPGGRTGPGWPAAG